MKHAHVEATLLAGEGIAPFAALADPDADPVERPSRLQCEWDGAAFTERDPVSVLREVAEAMRRCAR